jgi:hypothetical protein
LLPRGGARADPSRVWLRGADRSSALGDFFTHVREELANDFSDAYDRPMKLAASICSLLIALALALALAGCLDGQSRHHVPPAEQRALPVDEYALGESLCPAKYVPGSLAAKWQRRAVRQYRALRLALRQHPDWIVTAHYSLSDPENGEDPNQTEELTIFQLAQTDVGVVNEEDTEIDLDVEGAEPISCRQKMRRELVRLMGPERVLTRP